MLAGVQPDDLLLKPTEETIRENVDALERAEVAPVGALGGGFLGLLVGRGEAEGLVSLDSEIAVFGAQSLGFLADLGREALVGRCCPEEPTQIVLHGFCLGEIGVVLAEDVSSLLDILNLRPELVGDHPKLGEALGLVLPGLGSVKDITGEREPLQFADRVTSTDVSQELQKVLQLTEAPLRVVDDLLTPEPGLVLHVGLKRNHLVVGSLSMLNEAGRRLGGELVLPEGRRQPEQRGEANEPSRIGRCRRLQERQALQIGEGHPGQLVQVQRSDLSAVAEGQFGTSQSGEDGADDSEPGLAPDATVPRSPPWGRVPSGASPD